MPPACVPDSEDEDELDMNASQESMHSWPARTAQRFLSPSENSQDHGPNRQNPPGTTSSELLRDVVSAQRDLFGTAPDAGAAAMPSSTSPVLERKRRQTTTSEPGPAASSSNRSVKRTKTANPKTYGSKAPKPRPLGDHEKWISFRDGALSPAPTFTAPTSENVAPIQETGSFSNLAESFRAETGIPAGTLQQDFMEHEPAVMFRDTGSTMAFNESSEQRLVEQAVRSSKQVLGIPDADTAQSEKNDSSPFPYSASTKPTQSQGLDLSNTHQKNSLIDDHHKNEQAAGVTAAKHVQDTTAQGQPDQNRDAGRDVQSADGNVDTGLRPVQKSSPVVEITRRRSSAAKSPDDILVNARNEPTQKKTKGRKRKSHDSSDGPVELLNSDEREIGQPREQYKPRLTRRRATEVAHDNIDYSVVPEKAAKKRRKTDTASIASVESQIAVQQATQKTSQRPDDGMVLASKPAEPQQPSTVDPNFEETQSSVVLEKTQPPRSPEKPSTVPAPAPERNDTPKSLKSSQDAIAMPPPSLPASATKRRPRRSHTTIFEDHVSPRAFNKSPNLSQQQASRRSALQELPTASSQRKGKRSRIIADSDDDEEDELAKDDASVQETTVVPKKGRTTKAPPPKKAKASEKVVEDSDTPEENEIDDVPDDSAPKKKGRGAQKKAKSKEKVVEDSDTAEEAHLEEEIDASAPKKEGRGPQKKAKARAFENSDTAEEDDPEDAAEDSPPKKKGRSRPKKAQQPPGDPKATEAVKIASSDDMSAIAKTTESNPANAALQRKDANQQLNVNNTTETTRVATPSATPQKPDAKQGPASHSPINKTQAGVTYRVGLSKRSRIPSLLKTFRPPPKQPSR